MRTVAIVLSLVTAGPVFAQTGVSDDRVSLPEGPGSLEGIGENASADKNKGLFNHSVRIPLPQGYPGLSPDVSLNYSSGGGASVVGMGWSLPMPGIERLTRRGVPVYDADDEFAANGSEELVRVSNGAPATYRARFEGGFVRYRWYDSGAEGYWTAEYPDGRIGYFGATADGTLDVSARVSGDQGTFRYLLTEMVDRYGHRIRYTWTPSGTTRLPLGIHWAFDGGVAHYEVTFLYDDRPDPVSDATPGFDERLQSRLATLFVRAGGEVVRKVHLTYEGAADSGGLSRLREVTTEGTGGNLFELSHRFSYSQSLGGTCTGDGCTQPYVTIMPTALGVSLSQGNTTLIDINGDGLSDILDTSQGGPHRFFINTLGADGGHDFAPAAESVVGSQSSHDLSSKAVQVLDVDGDGFADILNAQQGTVLRNRGQGDWEPNPLTLFADGQGGLPNDFVPADGELQAVRFLDYDGDKRIDVIKSTGSDSANVTEVYRNTGGAFVLDTAVEPIGKGFDSETLELNDMNGDGLLDAVQVQSDQVWFRLNLGRGRWGAATTISGFDFTDAEQIAAELEDLNGDALADLVLVSGTTVRYWLNRGGEGFDAEATITSGQVDGELPSAADKVVLFADVNANGSSDVVWVDASGQVTYLELFPERPNLLTRIENGLGRVIDVTYRSSAEEMAEDGGWDHPLPHPMTVVSEIDEWDTLTGVHTIARYRYHHGYYDGDEKRFQGYAAVETTLPGDDLQRSGATHDTYDLGADDPYRAGLLLTTESYSEDALIERQTNTWSPCALEGVPDSGLLWDVEHQCLTLVETQHIEGLADSSQWLTTTVARTYDGYGNVVLQEERGLTGGCGDACPGDERYQTIEYAVPADNDDRWILRHEVRRRLFAALADGGPADASYAETVTYYDGDDFVGLPWGQVTHGTPVRVVNRVNEAGDTIETQRNALDAHGNVVEQILPNGSLDDADDHRVVRVYDALGLRLVRSEVRMTDEDGPYALVRDYAYHPLFDTLEGTTRPYVVSGEPSEPAQWILHEFDEFGRRIATAWPGASLDAPTVTFEHQLTLEPPRVVERRRTDVDAEPSLESVHCYDGQGRIYQSRTRIEAGRWLVSGFAEFGARGEIRQRYRTYEAASGECDLAAPADTPAFVRTFDGLLRELSRTRPLDGEPVVHTTTYLPLTEIVADGEDNRAGGPHQGTPEVRRYNGLDQLIAVERTLSAGGEPLVHTYALDETGLITQVTDPTGLTRTQTRDLLGRITQVVDPDRGTLTYEYDAAGNRIRRVDGAGVATVMTYDALNRLTADWREDAAEDTRVQRRWDRSPDGCSECTFAANHLAAIRYPLEDAAHGEDRFGYTALGHPRWTSRSLGGRTWTTETAFDHQGRQVSHTLATGQTIERVLDGAARVTAIPGFVSAQTYDAWGRPASTTLANGVVREMTVDSLDRPVGLVSMGPAGQALMAHTLTWDHADNLVAVSDERTDDGHPMGSAVYTYDALYRMTQAELDPDRPEHREQLSFTFDAAERLLERTSDDPGSPAHVGELAYTDSDHPRAVTAAGGLSYTYDGAGRALARGGQTYTWDHRGRLLTARDGGSTLGEYVYGAGTERILQREGEARVVATSPDTELRDWVGQSTLDAGWGRLAVILDPTFTAKVLSDLAPASGADTALTPAPDGWITSGDAWLAQGVGAEVLALATADEPSEVASLLHAANRRALLGDEVTVRYELRDDRGHLVAVTDDAGALLARYEYYPYGQPRYASGEEPSQGFQSQSRDASGLVHFGYRQLDPVSGRWMTPDPAFELMETAEPDRLAEAMATYSYVLGNPVSTLEQEGQFIILATVAVVLVVVAIGLPKALKWGGQDPNSEPVPRPGPEGSPVPEYEGASVDLGNQGPNEDALDARARFVRRAQGRDSAYEEAVRRGTRKLLDTGLPDTQDGVSLQADVHTLNNLTPTEAATLDKVGNFAFQSSEYRTRVPRRIQAAQERMAKRQMRQAKQRQVKQQRAKQQAPKAQQKVRAKAVLVN